MYILADKDGKVMYIGILPMDGAVKFEGTIPTDFNNTFALGKYTFVNGAINEVAGWVAPPPPPAPPGIPTPPAA